MSTEINVTAGISERDAVLRERAAFCRGSDWRHARYVGRANASGETTDVEVSAANKAYPFPKVSRPRVVEAPLGYYDLRFVHGVLQERRRGTENWYTAHSWEGTRELMAVIADLLANPTEEVDA